MVFKVYNENSGGNRSPMRSVQSMQYGYIFNAWSDGERVFKTATTGTMTYRAMQELATTDEAIAARLEMFRHNVPEEFYDYKNDPDALHNLINDPKYADAIAEHREAMRSFMIDSNDPMLEAFENRDDKTLVSAYVDRVQAESDARRQNRRANNRNNANQQNANQNLFKLTLPATASAGEEFVVVVEHKLPQRLGEQKFHVTLKDADGNRIERIVESATGNGQLEVTFKLPESYSADSIIVSTFVGEVYQSNLLHRTKGPVPVDQ